MSNKNTVKVAISLSSDMYEKVVFQAEALDLTANTLLKQLAISKLNNTDISFLSSEHKLVIKEFNENQLRMLQALNKVAELSANGEELEIYKIRRLFKHYKEDFESMIEKLNSS